MGDEDELRSALVVDALAELDEALREAGPDEVEDRTRAVWAAGHGLAILEIDGRYPGGADLDPAWSTMVAVFTSQPSA